MDKDTVFKAIKYVEDVPLVLLGTGATIPYGIPGMSDLARHLVSALGVKYSSDAQWTVFSDRLVMGVDLESALTGLAFSEAMLDDIARSTWELISEKDLILFYRVVKNEIDIILGKLLKRLCVPHPCQIKVITTNYDRVVEYACDQYSLSINTLSNGCYMKQIDSGTQANNKNNVTVLKVHGSLDWFENDRGMIYSIGLQIQIPNNMHPKIIPPGSEKYRSIAQFPCRDVIHIADDFIGRANGFLCIGYGFNDEQIQANMVRAFRQGKPLVVVTKKLSATALAMIQKDSAKYVLIQEGNTPGFTEFITNDGVVEAAGNYWALDEFISILF